MLADFEIHIHGEDERVVRVKVHKDVKALRKAAKRYAKRNTRSKKERKKLNMRHTKLLGVCHRFQRMDDPLCAIVRLAPPYIGVGVISHELAHAAVWIRSLDEGEDTILHCGNDERFCWVLGELVRQTINTMQKKGIFDDG